jgi:DNA-binding response OmpR family regulator
MNNVTLSPRTALVIDDNHILLDALYEALEDAGFDTTAVDRGSPAMTMLAERCFDVLVVDINLPDMNGLSICELARKQYQDQVAILVITGLKIERRGLASLQVCADDFLGKPFDIDELIARIESKLRRASKN